MESYNTFNTKEYHQLFWDLQLTNLEVESCTEQNIGSSRMPFYVTDPLWMAMQVSHAICEILLEPSLRNLPNFDLKYETGSRLLKAFFI